MRLLIICLLTLFTEANTQYIDGNYKQAAELYQQMLTEQPSAEVYYNLGNAQFKAGELAQAIIAYERCLRLKPNYKDAQYNLRFAQSQIIDNIEDTHTFFLSNWLKYIRNQFLERTWSIMSIVAFIIFLTALLCFLLLVAPVYRKLSFYTAIIALIVTIIAFANAGSLHQRDTLRREAVITQGIVNAKAAPDKSGTDLFTLHEGTKVEIYDVIGEWCNIHVGNNIGWIRLANLERI